MKVRSLSPGGQAFFCPGCKCVHAVNQTGPRWGYNNDPTAPTFSPSILVTYTGSDASEADAPPSRCHSFVRDGQIQFLADSTHDLAGQTVPIPDWPYAAGTYDWVTDADA